MSKGLVAMKRERLDRIVIGSFIFGAVIGAVIAFTVMWMILKDLIQ